ncbi:MAG: ATP-binding protein [Bacteroidota bacterium]
MIARWLHIIFCLSYCSVAISQTDQPSHFLPAPSIVSTASYGFNEGLSQNCLNGVFRDSKGRLWLNPCDFASLERKADFFQFDGRQSYPNTLKLKELTGNPDTLSMWVTGETSKGFLYGHDYWLDIAFLWHPDTDEQYIFSFDDDEQIVTLVKDVGPDFFVMTKKGQTIYLYRCSLTGKEMIGSYEFEDSVEIAFEWHPTFSSVSIVQDKLWVICHTVGLLSFDLQDGSTDMRRIEDLFKDKSKVEKFKVKSEYYIGQHQLMAFNSNELLLFLGHEIGFFTYNIINNQLVPIHYLNDLIATQPGNAGRAIFWKDLKGNFLVALADHMHSNFSLRDVYNEKIVYTFLLDQEKQLYNYSGIIKELTEIAQYDNLKNWDGQFCSNNFKKELIWSAFSGLLTAEIQPKLGITTFPVEIGIRSITSIDSNTILFNTDLYNHILWLKERRLIPYSYDRSIFNPTLMSSIAMTEEKTIWFATHNSLLKYDYVSGSSDLIDLGNRFVKFDFIESNNLILFTDKGACFFFNTVTHEIKPFIYREASFSVDSYINDIHVVSDHEIWVAARNGLWYLDIKKGEVAHFNTDKGLVENNIMCVHPGEDGKLWLGTQNGGVLIFDPATQESKQISEVNGLSQNTVTGILADEALNRWIATFNGITVANSDGDVLFDLSVENGLIHNEFNTSSYYQMPDGRMLFGGVEGLNLIDPVEVKKAFNDNLPLRLFLTNIFFFDNKTAQERELKGLLGNEVLKIPAANRYLKLNFAMSKYVALNNHTYSYRLIPDNNSEGLTSDIEWSSLGPVSELILNNLPVGNFIVQVRAFDQNGRQSDNVLEVPIKVKQFFYRQWWFYVLCAVPFVLGALLWMRRILTERKRLQKEVARRTQQIQKDKELIEQQAEELRSIDKLKNRFFANISHEFRTPLTIILGMADQLIKNPQKAKEGGKLIQKNGANLLDLINQMLELQKLESDKLTVNMQLGDIMPLLKNIFDQFHAYAVSKQQKMKLISEIEKMEMDHDPEKILRILSNLLSNAIKYTPEQGEITFSILTNQTGQFIFSVKDTGLGIPEEQIHLIFDRFFQTSYSQHIGGGTGIGLSLTYELVKLLNGRIEVESEVGKGSTFTVYLPITKKALPAQTLDPGSIQKTILGFGETSPSQETVAEDLPVALIVEDNADIRQYLLMCLNGHYQVIQAENGKEGIDLALEHIPDIIISDVMMPERDGFEVCETVKEDIRTSHIPIILLTAKSDVASRIYGLRHGADDYLGKPFHEEELLVRMENLLALRKKLHERYLHVFDQPIIISKEKVPNREDEFILQFKEIIDDHLSDPKFEVEELCNKMHMSRSHLGKKIKALTGRSLNIYIRSLRLQKAKQLIITTNMPIKEVGYEVGFFNSTYFSRIYSEEFGETPSITRENR